MAPQSSIAGLAMDPFFILDTGAAATDYGGKSSEGLQQRKASAGKTHNIGHEPTPWQWNDQFRLCNVGSIMWQLDSAYLRLTRPQPNF